ncbi:histidine kinase [Actinoplanes octamycinicus]|nr:two-component sensor histidine kinase [Actinoplanes octamycinicus]
MRDRHLVGDLVLAGLLGVPAVVATAVADRMSRGSAPIDWLGWALLVAAALGLTLRRRRPVLALAVVSLCTAAFLATGFAYGPILIIFMVAVHSAVRHGPLRAALWCAGGALGLLLVHLVTSDRPLGWLGIGPVAAWVVVPATLGYGLRLRHDAAQRDRAETIRRHVDEERLRVAQEVHDIVGHGLAAITLQADVALHVMARKPDHAQGALTAIRDTSRQALDELRGALAVLRAPPRLREGMDQLTRRMADAGVAVRLTMSGTTGSPVPPAVDLAAYRVVQESLTNVLRHGGCARADVTVTYSADALSITVTNPRTGPVGDGSGSGSGSAAVRTGDGSGSAAMRTGDGSDSAAMRTGDGFSLGAMVIGTMASGAGSGIAGMRARVQALGGALTAGPVGENFEVRARLPIGDPP